MAATEGCRKHRINTPARKCCRLLAGVFCTNKSLFKNPYATRLNC